MYIERVKTINLEKGSIKVSCKNITFYISLDLNLLKQKKKTVNRAIFPVICQPLLGLILWYPDAWSSLCNSFEGQAIIYEIYAS